MTLPCQKRKKKKKLLTTTCSLTKPNDKKCQSFETPCVNSTKGETSGFDHAMFIFRPGHQPRVCVSISLMTLSCSDI